MARRDKAAHLEQERQGDKSAVDAGRAQFAQSAYTGHTAYDPNANLYEARYRAFVLREAMIERLTAAFVRLRCSVLGHRFEDGTMKDRGYIEKCKRGCPATKYW